MPYIGTANVLSVDKKRADRHDIYASHLKKKQNSVLALARKVLSADCSTALTMGHEGCVTRASAGSSSGPFTSG